MARPIAGAPTAPTDRVRVSSAAGRVAAVTRDTDDLRTTHLGGSSMLPASPEEAILDAVPNPHPGTLYLVRFSCPEFTVLCPTTGQPNFAHLVIDYAPEAVLVEGKSLELFLGSFRNHGAFHEDCTVAIAKRVIDAIEPIWLRIAGCWYPRDGMAIDQFYQSGPPPESLWLPDIGVASYRGRG